MEIMLNKSFIGSWGLESEDNIPHEIINRYRSDGGKVFLYVPPYGGLGNEHEVRDILITSDWHDNTTEVYYWATDLRKLHNGGKKPKDFGDQVLKDLSKIIRGKESLYNLGTPKKDDIKYEIKYGGAYLDEIKMSSDTVEDLVFPLTFEAGKIYKPKSRLFITWGNAKGELPQGKHITIASDYKYQRQTGYLDREDAHNKELVDWLDGPKDNSWQEIDLPKVPDNVPLCQNRNTFVKLIHKEYDETTYTNLLFHFLSLPGIFRRFAKQVLKIEPLSENYTVNREVALKSCADSVTQETKEKDGRIDLVVTGCNDVSRDGIRDVIVIENKLRSGLNGIDKHNSISQLTTYHKYIERKYEASERFYFLLEPNYNDIDIARFDSNAKDSYKVRKYSEVYAFFNSIRDELRETELGKYSDDFVDALSIHAMTMEDTVNCRFIKAIRRSKEEK